MTATPPIDTRTGTPLANQLALWREAHPEVEPEPAPDPKVYTPKTTPAVRSEVVRVARLIMARHYAETLAEIVEDLNNAEAALKGEDHDR